MWRDSSFVGPMSYLLLENITKRFGAFTAVDRVSLTIEEGEFVCFLGPSGCGKTTLLRAIAGLDFQSEGRIVQAGRDVSMLPPRERDFGIVFQSYALFPNLTVRQNIAYGLENRGMARRAITERVAELLKLVGLEDQGDKYPAQLSGGQQQRVALARALAPSPGLLLLDEPLSALDAKVRLYLRHEIRDLQRKLNVTTIMVTHDQEEALSIADRIVVMHGGHIEQVGTPIEIYQDPATPFVADFVGSMNFVDGVVVEPGRCRIADLGLECATDGLAPEEAVTVAIRPEDVVVRAVTAETRNRFSGRILRTDFLGPFLRVEIGADMLGAVRLLVDLSINVVRDLDIEPGREMELAVPPERIRLYPARAH